MATQKTTLKKYNPETASWDSIYLASSSDIVTRPSSGNTVEADLEALLPETQAVTTAPVSAAFGKLVVGSTGTGAKAWVGDSTGAPVALVTEADNPICYTEGIDINTPFVLDADTLDGSTKEQILSDYTKSLRQAITFTALDTLTAHTFTQDDSGSALNAKALVINVLVPSGCTSVNTTANLTAQFNSVATGYFEYGAGATTATTIGGARSVSGVAVSTITMLGDHALVKTAIGVDDGTTSERSEFFTLTPALGATTITRIDVSVSDGYTYPAGTIIEIWQAQ